mgnify:CR=1 FL=1
MNYHNPYLRLQTYYTWLLNDIKNTSLIYEYTLGISIQKLHELTQIPLIIIRNDFLTMFGWQSNLVLSIQKTDFFDELSKMSILSFDNDSEDYQKADQLYHVSDLYESLMTTHFPKQFQILLVEGAFDHLPIYLEYNIGETYCLALSCDESAALQMLDEETIDMSIHPDIRKLGKLYTNSYMIKDSYLYTHQYTMQHSILPLHKKLDLLNEAITGQTCLLMKYRSAKSQIHEFVFRPLKISYDADENLYAVLSIYNDAIQVHRLDHILSLEKSNLQLPVPNMKKLDIYPNVWGNSFTDQPEFVKVKFYNEANVWAKVRKELAYRTNGKLYEKDGFLYYEDTVYGINKFRAWIRGYGSSAIVIEPKSLQEQILESLRIRAEEYGLPLNN